MSKLIFEDNSYVEIRRGEEPNKILLLIGARDSENSFRRIINCVEITQEEFKMLVGDVING